MSVIAINDELYSSARAHLRGHVEQVGFLLADYDSNERRFLAHTWRPMPPESFEFQSAYHVTLRDEARPEVIQWAWQAKACLIEVHSHGDEGTACLSASDICGLSEWVPHVRWRLRGKPYAAIVTAGNSFDGLAWVEPGRDAPAEQVRALEVADRRCSPTRLSLPRLRSSEEVDRGL